MVLVLMQKIPFNILGVQVINPVELEFIKCMLLVTAKNVPCLRLQHFLEGGNQAVVQRLKRSYYNKSHNV